MCNSIHRHSLPVPASGYGYKFLRLPSGWQRGVFPRSCVKDTAYDKNPFEKYVYWNHKMYIAKTGSTNVFDDAFESDKYGFCLFPTIFDARIFQMECAVSSGDFLFKVHYCHGLGMHYDNDCGAVILIAKAWRVWISSSIPIDPVTYIEDREYGNRFKYFGNKITQWDAERSCWEPLDEDWRYFLNQNRRGFNYV